MTTNQVYKRMEALFTPRSVAVVGASESPDKLGYHVMQSLLRGGYGGTIVPVNPRAETLFGLPCRPSLGQSAEAIDLAIVAVPAGSVPAVFDECAAKGVKGVVLITAGFKEIDDPEGARLQSVLAKKAGEAGLPVIGPNTFGLVNLHHRLNASFTPEFSLVPKGDIAIVSQSGGISHLLGFLALQEGVGLSKIIGLGNRLNIDFAEMVAYLAEDSQTRVVALYVEGIDNPRQLMRACQALRGRKPIVALKTGEAHSGDASSRSHTGSMAGNQAIYKAAFQQSGILSVDSTGRLLDAGKALAGCPLPGGPRVAILTGQAGPGMAAADVCERGGLDVAAFQGATQAVIDQWLPPLAHRSNPVDMGPAWYNGKAIEEIVRAVMGDPAIDMILLLMMFASANREALGQMVPLLREWAQAKPVVTCLVAPPGIWDASIAVLEQGRAIVNFTAPERAAQAAIDLWQARCLAR